MQSNWTAKLQSCFEKNRNSDIAQGQSAYMRNKFKFLGIKTPERKQLAKAFLSKPQIPPYSQLHSIIKELWQLSEREYQYTALDLIYKYHTQFTISDIDLMEYMVTCKSWWDTVDIIAGKLMGIYFLSFPEKKQFYTNKWLGSDNIWLQRCAVLFQLKYKEKTDTKMLSETICNLDGSSEFFINKAIGWALREYAKTNPQWVIEFTKANKLAPLSRREALKHL